MKSAVIALLLMSGSACAAPIAGTWTINGDVQGHPVHETCTLSGPDTGLSGTCTGQKSYPATAVLTDNVLTLKHAGEYQGQDLALTFSGRVQSDGSISGTIDVQPLNYDGSFAATRTADAPPKTEAPK